MEDVRFLGRHFGVARQWSKGSFNGSMIAHDFVPGDKAVVAGVPAGTLVVQFVDNIFQVLPTPTEENPKPEPFIIPVTSIIQLIGEHIG